MKLATILPTKYLWLSADEDYHMCLAHLVEKDMEYTNFFKDMAARGHYVIMDNSVIENAQVSISELCGKARRVGASEIILPDAFRDCKKTLEMSYEALNYVRTHCPELKVMVVPQGKNLSEWLDCFNIMLTWNVDCIGIPKVASTFPEVGNIERGRVLAEIKNAIDEYNELHARKTDIHLLGCWYSPIELLIITKLEAQGRVPVVRGCDSAIAYAFTANGSIIGEEDRLQGIPVNFNDTNVDLKLLEENIERWYSFVDIKPRKVKTLY